MARFWTLALSFGLLSYGFWASKDFKTIAAGVSIFLFGMLFLEDGFTYFSGGVLERTLKKSTDKTHKSILFGLVSTTVMQSSSLISVITISFISAGLIELASGIGIIFGANLGTTTGAWLMAGLGMKVKISAYAMPMLVFGLILNFQHSKTMRGIGKILAGLGFLFLGIHYMKEGFEAFKTTIDLSAYAMDGFRGDVIFLLIGVVATVIMQSSHATLMLILAALASAQISYENALSLAIGANIGTTITAIIGSLSSTIQGKRLALAHLIFNAVTALIAIIFLKQFMWAVDELSLAIGIRADDWTLKLAVFHTLFNLVGVLVMTPLIGRLVTGLERFVKPKSKGLHEPIYLNESALQLPDTALNVLYQEANHLYEVAFGIVAHGLNLHRTDIISERDIQHVVVESNKPIDINVRDEYYRVFKNIYNEIIEFSTQAMAQLNNDQMKEVYDIRVGCRHLAEVIKDVVLMQENVCEYLVSHNGYIRDQYNRLRTQLALILRRIEAFRNQPDETFILFELKELKESLESNDVSSNGVIDNLVRKSLISLEMATSLINDSAYTYSIGKRLLEVAKNLLVPRDSDLFELKAELMDRVHEMKEVPDGADQKDS